MDSLKLLKVFNMTDSADELYSEFLDETVETKELAIRK